MDSVTVGSPKVPLGSVTSGLFIFSLVGGDPSAVNLAEQTGHR